MCELNFDRNNDVDVLFLKVRYLRLKTTVFQILLHDYLNLRYIIIIAHIDCQEKILLKINTAKYHILIYSN